MAEKFDWQEIDRASVAFRTGDKSPSSDEAAKAVVVSIFLRAVSNLQHTNKELYDKFFREYNEKEPKGIIEIDFKVNGIDFPFLETLRSFYSDYRHSIQREAENLVKAKANSALEVVETIRERLDELGRQAADLIEQASVGLQDRS